MTAQQWRYIKRYNLEEETLVRLGLDGWELVSVVCEIEETYVDEETHKSYNTLYVFKRPTTEQT